MNRSGCARSRSRSTRISPRGNKEGNGVGQGDRQRREEGGRDHRDKCRMSASDPAVTRDHRWDPCLPRALAKQVARLVRVRFPPPPPFPTFPSFTAQGVLKVPTFWHYDGIVEAVFCS